MFGVGAHLRRSVNLVSRRSLSLSGVRRETFRVQDEEDFAKNVLSNPDPVLVDFSATWCGPCKLLSPRLDAALAATEGKVHLAIVDIDDLGEIAADHGVNVVPTVIAYKQGQVVDKFVGVVEEDKLAAFVNKLI